MYDFNADAFNRDDRELDAFREKQRLAALTWTKCQNCGSAVPEVDAEEGICVDCWDGRQFTANARVTSG